MQSRILFTVIAGLFATGVTYAQPAPAGSAPPPSPDKDMKMQRHFAQLDKNGDGAISRDEAAGHKALAGHFDEMDADKDGKLTREEMQAYRASMHGKHMAKFDEKFKAADKDGDGALTKAEADAAKMPGLVKHFEQIDINKDGKVTKEEMQ